MAEKNKSFFRSRIFLTNLIVFVVLCVVFFVGLSAWLNSYTHHGENIDVPDLRGKSITSISNIKEGHFLFKVVDSLYDGDRKPGAILDQDPTPHSKVKENRTIYLTINATQPPDVKMPDLIDVSIRQAEAILGSFGLVMGELSFRSDLAKNAVLEQRYKNRSIKPGTMLPKGSVIDLVLGDGLESADVIVPDLTGLSLAAAEGELKSLGLNSGLVQFDDGADGAESKVYDQTPGQGSVLKKGAGVDISLR